MEQAADRKLCYLPDLAPSIEFDLQDRSSKETLFWNFQIESELQRLSTRQNLVNVWWHYN